MAYTPQEIWDHYRKFPTQDMYHYSPFLREIAKGNILEIGVRGGVSTAAFLLGLDDKKEGHLYSIDIDPECRNIFDHPRWSFLYGDSNVDMFDVPELDILLVDGDHRYQPALKDLTRFEPYVKKGGIIMMHDVEPDLKWIYKIMDEGWYPVEECRRAWKDFERAHPAWKSYIKPGITGLGVMEKGDE